MTDDPYLTTKTAYFSPRYADQVNNWMNNVPRRLRNRTKAYNTIPKKFAYKQLKGETNTNRSTNK